MKKLSREKIIFDILFGESHDTLRIALTFETNYFSLKRWEFKIFICLRNLTCDREKLQFEVLIPSSLYLWLFWTIKYFIN